MIPIFLNMTARLAVVVGGGAVGQRKARTLLAAGAQVRLVCLEDQPATAEWAGVDWRAEAYRPAHLQGAALVFAAATAAVNRQVVADAQQQGIWVNACDDPEAADFFLPATVRRGTFVVAIGTGGAAPALARRVRQRLERQYDDAFGRWVALLAELRPVVLAQVADPLRRRDLFDKLCHWRWLRRLRQETDDQVRTAMQALIQKVADASDHAI
jgi:precorrin-2 dehydrogenase/sirohydrochlorin ferrochelatase